MSAGPFTSTLLNTFEGVKLTICKVKEVYENLKSTPVTSLSAAFSATCTLNSWFGEIVCDVGVRSKVTGRPAARLLVSCLCLTRSSVIGTAISIATITNVIMVLVLFDAKIIRNKNSYIVF